ncbi:proline iminopeptidase-family hydrolase [Spongorhabdus nitratireducens]
MQKFMRRQDIRISGRRVATYHAGSGDNVLLMIHGGPGCSSHYLHRGHYRLTEQGFRLITWDQMGGGNSESPVDPYPWRMERFVSEVESIRLALELEDFQILGHSWGGILGLEYILTYPNIARSFIAANTSFDMTRSCQSFERCRAALGRETCRMMALREAENSTDHPEYQAALTLLQYRHSLRLDEWPEEFRHCLNKYNQNIKASVFGSRNYRPSGWLRHYNRMDKLDRIRIPVLLIAGEYDFLEADWADLAAEQMPSATVKAFRGCSHSPFLEAPQAYLETVGNFLKQQI